MKFTVDARGISLVEVMIGGAIAIGIGIGLTKVSINANNGVKLTERNQEIVSILGEFRNTLSNPASCAGSFGGMSATSTLGITAIKDSVSNGSDQSAAFFDLTTGATKVGIGTRTPTYKLHVMGQVAGSGAYLNTSDERFKRNINKIPNALSKIMGINGVSFDWRYEEYPGMNFVKRTDIGMTAQNVERFFPEAVVENEKGFKSVAYSKLIAPLIEAVKEQQKSIELLKNQNNSLIKLLCQKNMNEKICKNNK